MLIVKDRNLASTRQAIYLPTNDALADPNYARSCDMRLEDLQYDCASGDGAEDGNR